jgi:serine phosphatase RsbU (regulator of sigma subunit)
VKHLLFICFIIAQWSQAQKDVFILDTLGERNSFRGNQLQPPGKNLDLHWKFHDGDDQKWAAPDCDDKNWREIPIHLNIEEDLFKGKAWFRLHIRIDSAFLDKDLVLMLNHWGASEIYINGKFFHRFGFMDRYSLQKDTCCNPQALGLPIRFNETQNIIAIRYHNKHFDKDLGAGFSIGPGLKVMIGDPVKLESFVNDEQFFSIAALTFYFAFFIALGLLHFFFFLFYTTNRSNLFYSIFAISFGSIFASQIISLKCNDAELLRSTMHFFLIVPTVYSSSLLAMLFTIFYKKLTKLFWLWFGLILLEVISDTIGYSIPYLGLVNTLIIIIEPIRLVIAATIKKKDGAWILAIGVTSTILFFLGFLLIVGTGHGDWIFNNKNSFNFLSLSIVVFGTLSIPLSMSIYLAREFAKTNKSLEKKLIEVEDLSVKNLEQEKEKQQILADQNVNLEKQVKERTHEINEQKKIIEEKNKDITDSIAYAKRIQDATLPPKELKYKLFPEAFVLFKPKDIVSGDFYWFAETEEHKFIAAADCTGHGVPGAMVSVVCSNALNRAIKEFKLREPGKILDKVRDLVLDSFTSSENSHVKDGMDISLCCLPKQISGKIDLKWAGANNPFWLIKNGTLQEITATKQPIGATENPTPFVTHNVECAPGDVFYLFSDGYADQFGGPKGKKLKYKQMLDYILSIQDKTMLAQEKFLDERFEEWKGQLAQIDDVLVIGVKL